MRSVGNTVFFILTAVIGAHALTFFLMSILPDAAVIALGIESVRPEVLSAFREAQHNRSYLQILAGIPMLDLGQTLDGTAVTRELKIALQSSLPRLLAAFFLVCVTFIAAVFFTSGNNGKKQKTIASFIAFLPPYVMPFIGLVTLLSLTFSYNVRLGATAYPLMATCMLAIPSGALIYSQAQSITLRCLQSDFARTLLAVGAGPCYQRSRILHNVVAEIIPSLEKVFVGLVAVLLFVEPIFGLSGFGTTAIRAIKRSDSELLLGVTLVLGVTVAFFRLISLAVRRQYGMDI